MLKPPLQPMLLSDLTDPFDSDDYLFEFKWDGYRSLIFVDGKQIYLQSRNQKNLTPYFPEFNNLHRSLNGKNIVLDGEICILDKKGWPVFALLQGRLSRKTKKIKYQATLIIWDILQLEDKEVYHLPLSKRKEILEPLITSNQSIQLSPFIEKKGVQLYQMAEKENIEGIVAKRLDSPYEFKRSSFWYKIKVWQYTDVLICGYSIDRTGLVVGRSTDYDINNPDKKLLKYMGKVKLALNKNEAEALFRFLPSLKIASAPFQARIKTGQVQWVKPAIRCKVRYTEITRHNTFRHGYAVKLLLDKEG